MMIEHDLLEAMILLGEEGVLFCSAVVTESRGSTPREAGSRMLIAKDGRKWGSVGGGPVELKVEQLALDRMREGETGDMVLSFLLDTGLDSLSNRKRHLLQGCFSFRRPLHGQRSSRVILKDVFLLCI